MIKSFCPNCENEQVIGLSEYTYTWFWEGSKYTENGSAAVCFNCREEFRLPQGIEEEMLKVPIAVAAEPRQPSSANVTEVITRREGNVSAHTE